MLPYLNVSCAIAVWRKYGKKTQSTETDRRDIAAPPENRPLDKEIVRYIIHSLLLVILFAWALIKLDSVMRFLEKVLSLFSPFLLGGGIAFLINVVLTPLERRWNRACRKIPAKLARPVCLTLSAVLVFGILFAVVFMMIPFFQAWSMCFWRSFLLCICWRKKSWLQTT